MWSELLINWKSLWIQKEQNYYQNEFVIQIVDNKRP